eukprot:s1590_g8.t1
MSQWGNRSWSDWDKWSPHRSWSWEVSLPLPSSWKLSEIHYDETVLHGYPLYRHIQPSAWSRKRGIHGQDPLHLPVYHLLRYGVEEFSLRTLSAGRFVGLVPTRSVAESVFVSQLLRTSREANLDIDSIAEHLHRIKAPTAPVPSKQEAPVDFISPVVVSAVDLLKQIQPVRQDGLALRRVQSLEAQLKEAQAKLAEAEAEKVVSVPPASPARSAGHKRDSSALGSTPKRRAKAKATPPQASGQPKLATVFSSQKQLSLRSPPNVEEDQFSDEKSPITVKELLQASGPILKQYPITGTSDPTLKRWLQQFPAETQQEATKFTKMFQEAAVPKAKLQEAAIQYGLPMEQSLKFPFEVFSS